MKRLLLPAALLCASVLPAQAPRACDIEGTLTLPKLRSCIDITLYSQQLQIDSLRRALAQASGGAVKSAPPGIVTAPPTSPPQSPTGLTMPALTAGQIAGVTAEVDKGIAQGRWVEMYTRARTELQAGVYSMFNPDLIEAMKELYFGGGESPDVYAYLAIIDQRDPATNLPLLRGDPRVRYVIGGPPGVQPAPQPGFAPYPGFTSNGAGDLLVQANLDHQSTQNGITDSYTGHFGINGWDGGFRILQNYRHEGTRYLPFGAFGMDSHATFSIGYWPAELGGESPDNAPWSATTDPKNPVYQAYSGQGVVIDLGSQVAYGYMDGQPLYSTRAVLFASQHKGWPIYFAVSPERPNGLPQNRAVMKLDGDGGPNPVNIVVGGSLRKVVPCVISGSQALCWE